MTNKFNLVLLTSVLLLMGCAASYKPMNTEKLDYINKQSVDSLLEVGYKYDIYSEFQNKKYSKKERANDYRVIAVQIKNLTPIPITLTTDNFKVYSGNFRITVVDLDVYSKDVRQASEAYALHALWGPWSYSYNETTGTSKFLYIPVGLTVGVINIIIAGTANKNHMQNLKDLNIYNKTVGPNDTLTGIICLKYPDYNELTFKFESN